MMKGKLKRCPSCGKFFACQGKDDCWCENFQIHKSGYLKLAEEYTDCICQDCLVNYAEK